MKTPYDEFLEARPVAVVGASNNRAKYGNIVLRNLRGRGWAVYAINPKEAQVEGEPAYPTLADCPVKPELAVLIVPPAAGLKVLDEAQAAGVERIWLQPGAESAEVLERARQLGLRVVHDACIMVLAAQRG